MMFYVGLDDLYYTLHFDRVFISVNRLRNRKSDFPVKNWIMDSGAFTEVTTHGGYRTPPEDYAKLIDRWSRVGAFECAVAQDYMCEPFVTEKTGLSVRRHQELTVERFAALSKMTNSPVMPVIQGFKPAEYIECIRLYGDLLQPGMRVGVGSICKRQSHPALIEYILHAIKREKPGILLHGFGLKTTALYRDSIRNALHSADSMAWSFHARKNGRDAHDWREAKAFEDKVNRVNKKPLWN